MVRKARVEDKAQIERVYESAFPAEEWETVYRIAESLLDNDGLCWVIESEGEVVAHVSYSLVQIEGKALGYILAPLAVSKELHSQGLGTKLVNASMEELKAAGVKVFFVYGDPNYYGRFGYSADLADGFEVPYTLAHPFGWQAAITEGEREDFPRGVLQCVDVLMSPDLW